MFLAFLKSKDIKGCPTEFVCEIYSLDDIFPDNPLRPSNYYILHLIPSKCVKNEDGKYIDSLCNLRYVENIDVRFIRTLDPILAVVTPYPTLPMYFPSSVEVSECVLKLYVNKKYMNEVHLILRIFPIDVFPVSLFPESLYYLEAIGFYPEDIFTYIPKEYVKELDNEWMLIDHGVEGLKKCVDFFIERCSEEGCEAEDIEFLKTLRSSLR